jgi:hypothetical protein
VSESASMLSRILIEPSACNLINLVASMLLISP